MHLNWVLVASKMLNVVSKMLPRLPRLRDVACYVSTFWRFILLALLTLLLTLNPVSTFAQTSPTSRNDKAPVVLDGRVLLQVRSLNNNFTAENRARQINEALAQAVSSPNPVSIEVNQEEGRTTILSQPGSHHLLTVTEGDLLPEFTAYRQAQIWRDILERALVQAQFERSPAYVRQALGFVLGAILIAIAIHVGLLFLGKWASHRLRVWLGQPTSSFHAWEDPAQFMVRLARLGLQGGLWLAIAYYVTDLFPASRIWRYELFDFIAKVFGILNAPVISLGSSKYSALELLLLLGLTIGLWFAVSSLTKLFKSYVLAHTGAEPRLQEVITILTQYILTFLGFIVLLQIWGLDVGSLTILASVLGVGIGFGVQNIANNFISGIIITFERPIQIGDFVKVGELLGTVERIGARSTEICTLDQVTIIVPNSRFLETEVINWSHGNPISRLRIPVGVAYGSDIDKVKTALLEAVKNHPEVLLQPPPQVWFQGFGESSLDFDLLVWTGEPKKQFKVKSDLNYRIEACMRHYDIEIPFPQRDLHLRSPQLEEIFNLLLYRDASTSSPRSIEPTNGDQSDHTPISQPQDSLTVATEISGAVSRTITPAKTLTETELEALVAAMRGADGVEIKDRRDRGNLYPQCFIGAEAVEWLAQRIQGSRQEAIGIGQMLIDSGIIHHVMDDYPFQDNYSFYRFYS
ncbi:mechanosensitive ion channel domain-containing protein [Coleofasciculus sp. G2-EDA-02]|uniref:mechanosensitive ion channel domain-containing protein n=1 Tax=Coleofasciculus sp. G2-EDA-02 TaxID=3069529 RepID=UPI0032F5494C